MVSFFSVSGIPKINFDIYLRKQKVNKEKSKKTNKQTNKQRVNKSNLYFQVGIKTWSLLSPQQLDAKLVKTPTGCDQSKFRKRKQNTLITVWTFVQPILPSKIQILLFRKTNRTKKNTQLMIINFSIITLYVKKNCITVSFGRTKFVFQKIYL